MEENEEYMDIDDDPIVIPESSPSEGISTSTTSCDEESYPPPFRLPSRRVSANMESRPRPSACSQSHVPSQSSSSRLQRSTRKQSIEDSSHVFSTTSSSISRKEPSLCTNFILHRYCAEGDRCKYCHGEEELKQLEALQQSRQGMSNRYMTSGARYALQGPGMVPAKHGNKATTTTTSSSTSSSSSSSSSSSRATHLPSLSSSSSSSSATSTSSSLSSRRSRAGNPGNLTQPSHRRGMSTSPPPPNAGTTGSSSSRSSSSIRSSATSSSRQSALEEIHKPNSRARESPPLPLHTPPTSTTSTSSTATVSKARESPPLPPPRHTPPSSASTSTSATASSSSSRSLRPPGRSTTTTTTRTRATTTAETMPTPHSLQMDEDLAFALSLQDQHQARLREHTQLFGATTTRGSSELPQLGYEAEVQPETLRQLRSVLLAAHRRQSQSGGVGGDREMEEALLLEQCYFGGSGVRDDSEAQVMVSYLQAQAEGITSALGISTLSEWRAYVMGAGSIPEATTHQQGDRDTFGIDMSYEALTQLEDVKVGVPQHLLDLLPVFPFEKPKASSSSSSSNSSRSPNSQGDNSRCSICLCDYEQGDLLTMVGCGHLFHHDCALPWLKDHKQCPVCKADVTTTFESSEDFATPPKSVCKTSAKKTPPIFLR